MKRKAARMVLLLTLAAAPAFLEGCIITDLLGGLGGGAGGGIGGLLGGGQQQPGGLGGVNAGNRPVAPIGPQALPAGPNRANGGLGT